MTHHAVVYRGVRRLLHCWRITERRGHGYTRADVRPILTLIGLTSTSTHEFYVPWHVVRINVKAQYRPNEGDWPQLVVIVMERRRRRCKGKSDDGKKLKYGRLVS